MAIIRNGEIILGDFINSEGGGGGSALVPSMTQAEYDALSDEEKMNGQIREITDATESSIAPFAVVSDEMATTSNVWTAKKTKDEVVNMNSVNAYFILRLLADSVNGFYSESVNDEAHFNDRACKRTSSEPVVWFRVNVGNTYDGWFCIGLTETSVICSPLTEYGDVTYAQFEDNGIKFYVSCMSYKFPYTAKFDFYFLINGKKIIPLNTIDIGHEVTDNSIAIANFKKYFEPIGVVDISSLITIVNSSIKAINETIFKKNGNIITLSCTFRCTESIGGYTDLFSFDSSISPIGNVLNFAFYGDDNKCYLAYMGNSSKRIRSRNALPANTQLVMDLTYCI